MPVDLPAHGLHLLRERDLHLLCYPLILMQQPLDLPQPARLALLLHLLKQQLVFASAKTLNLCVILQCTTRYYKG